MHVTVGGRSQAIAACVGWGHILNLVRTGARAGAGGQHTACLFGTVWGAGSARACAVITLCACLNRMSKTNV